MIKIQAAQRLQVNASLESVIADLTTAGLSARVKGAEDDYHKGIRVPRGRANKVRRGLAKLGYKENNSEKYPNGTSRCWYDKGGDSIYFEDDSEGSTTIIVMK